MGSITSSRPGDSARELEDGNQTSTWWRFGWKARLGESSPGWRLDFEVFRLRPTSPAAACRPGTSEPEAAASVSSEVCPAELEDSRSDAQRFVEINSSRYEIGELLGEGGHGKVYAGTRLSDGLQVAIKITKKLENDLYFDLPKYSKNLPSEIALMLMANKGSRIPEIIQLLDWQDEPTRYLLVLERMSPCQDLYDFIYSDRSVDERVARVIMQQLTRAAVVCCQRGVFHSDIKLENVLINPETLQVKLIDFGCGDKYKDSVYHDYSGTEEYSPPETRTYHRYHAKPLTAWTLGIVMYELVKKRFPSNQQLNITDSELHGLSEEFRDLVCRLLQRDPGKRMVLDRILQHSWFQMPGEEKRSWRDRLVDAVASKGIFVLMKKLLVKNEL